MDKCEIAKEILAQLEENHINLYHSVSKETVTAFLESLGDLNAYKNSQFDKAMLQMFALFQDAHTTYKVPFLQLNRKFRYIDHRLYLLQNNKYEQVLYINETPINSIVKDVTKLICYETDAWLSYKLNDVLDNGYFYQMLGLLVDGHFSVTTESDNKIDVEIVNSYIENKKPNYKYDIYTLNEAFLYVRYFKCKDMTQYLFADMVKDIEKTLNQTGITQYILDLRNNTGGDSEVLNPFQELVKTRKMKGVLIINNGVFSSGRFAVARFKESFNTPLIGEPTGGASKSYGYNKILAVEDKHFSVSTRLWDFSSIFNGEGSIQPDIYVPLTIEDLEQKIDRPLETAIHYLEGLNESERLELNTCPSL